MMDAAQVVDYLDQAVALGAREYYFTGGEPMMHPRFFELCGEALARGPLTVLTNGILIDGDAAARARTLFDGSRYSFDLRVSLDGMTADENDPVRGRGTFASICAGIAALARAGLSPTLTVVEHQAGLAAAGSRARFLAFARSLGLSHPRVKFLPLLRLGREPRRSRGYDADELDCLTQALDPSLYEGLVCTSSRLCTPDGVVTCPILLDAPGARLGRRLAETLAPVRLRWAACRTCIVDGLSCRT
jgi:molybdenum cofactor biosynthesis enzyme MoaA